MAAPVGSLGAFDHSKEARAVYVERLESHFYVNDTDEGGREGGPASHIKAVCWFGDKNKHYKKSKKVNQMSAAKCDSSNGSDDNEWSDGLHTLDAVHQLTKPKNRTDTASSRATA